MRRPKKLYRPSNSVNNAQNNSRHHQHHNGNSNASIAANRLGPGMETLDLSLTLENSSALGQEASQMGRVSTEPWIITWQVGVGASVDKGLVLAKVVRGRSGGEHGTEARTSREHVITGKLQNSTTSRITRAGQELMLNSFMCRGLADVNCTRCSHSTLLI